MTQIGWNESNPPDTESAGLGDDRIRSLMTSVRQGLAAEHTWPSAGGDAGIHLLGSARAYVGTQSQVSSSGTDGRLMFASDTSRFFHVGSGGTCLIGGQTVISAGSIPGTQTPCRHYWVEEFGVVGVPGASSGSVVVTYPNSGYSGAPYVYLNQWTTASTAADVTLTNSAAIGVTATTFIAFINGGSGSTVTLAWRSIGSRIL